MPDYSIYVLDESDATITGTTGGSGLDGVSQGDGSHLLGATITINQANWTQIDITDTDDPNFQDSDNSQSLNGAQEIDGTTYASGSVVEAEYGFTVTDPDGNTYQLIGFNVNNTSPAYGTVEGIAVIGGPGSFPPAGVPLTVTSTQEGPNFAAADYATPICFAADTIVETDQGPCPISQMQPGARVRARNGRFRRVRWVGQTSVAALGPFAPVRFEPGAFGATSAVEVSQQHRVLVTGWQAELLFGEVEVLVPAVALINDHNVRLRRGGTVTYVHLLLDDHELIETQGLISESLHPGPVALDGVSQAARDEVLALFPDLATTERPLCRPTLRVQEARVMALV